MEWPLNVPKVKSTRHLPGTENRRPIFAAPPLRVDLTGVGDDMADGRQIVEAVQLDLWADPVVNGDDGFPVAILVVATNVWRWGKKNERY